MTVVASRGIRIGLPAAGSLLVNAVLIVAIVTLGTGGTRRRVPAEVVTVLTLAAPRGDAGAAPSMPPVVAARPLTVAPPVSKTVPPPGPPRVPAVKVAAAIPVVPMPVAIARAVELAPAAPAIAVTPPAAAVASASARAPAPAPAVRPARPDGIDGAEQGTSLAYAARVRSWLMAHRVYPRRARMHHDEGVVLVRFVLDRAGMLIEGEILHRSGHAALDDEAVAMLSRASPYPAAPVGLAGNRIELTAPIAFLLPG